MTSAPGASEPGAPSAEFDDPDLLSVLESASGSGLDPDDLPFGLIIMNRDATVTTYNRFEAQRAGVRTERVLGRNFFLEVAPCTNNYLVLQRFVDATEQDRTLDEELDYVFTFRMRPTPVRLRLMSAAGSSQQYLAVRPR